MDELQDVRQRIAIVEVLYKDLLLQENLELRQKLQKFKVDNVQWVLNAFQMFFSEIEYTLDLEESNHLYK